MIRKIIIVVLTLAATGTAIVWVDSYQHHSQDSWGGHSYNMRGTRHVVGLGQTHSALIGWSRGHFAIVLTYVAVPADGDPVQFIPGLRRLRDLGKVGFKTRIGSFTAGPNVIIPGSHAWLAFPVWALLALLVAYPAEAFIRGPLRRYRRRKRGLCPTCEYDLRGSPERCPECGNAT